MVMRAWLIRRAVHGGFQRGAAAGRIAGAVQRPSQPIEKQGIGRVIRTQMLQELQQPPRRCAILVLGSEQSGELVLDDVQVRSPRENLLIDPDSLLRVAELSAHLCRHDLEIGIAREPIERLLQEAHRLGTAIDFQVVIRKMLPGHRRIRLQHEPAPERGLRGGRIASIHESVSSQIARKREPAVAFRKAHQPFTGKRGAALARPGLRQSGGDHGGTRRRLQ